MKRTLQRPRHDGLDLESPVDVNVWILSNRDAGRSLSDERLQKLVEQAGHHVVDLVATTTSDPRPPASGVDVVVAAGGDGTVATAMGLIAHANRPLAILPLGTANNIAASLGMKTDVAALISSWNQATRRPFDLAYAKTASQTWRVVEGLGGGLLPAGIAAAKRALEQHDPEPPPSAAISTATMLFERALKEMEPVRGSLVIDGSQSVAGDFVLFEVLNIRSIGPNLVLAPDASPSDGYLDVVVATDDHRSELLAYLDDRARGERPRLTLPTYRARTVEIDTGEALHIDDERVEARDRVAVQIARAAITVLV